MSKNLIFKQARRKVVSYSTIISIVVATSVLLGWTLDIPALTQVVPGFPSMKSSTAFALLFTAVALFLTFNATGRMVAVLHLVFSGLTVLAGAVALINFLFGLNVGIGQFTHILNTVGIRSFETAYMSHQSAANFILIGLAILLLNRGVNRRGRYSRVSEYLAVSAFTLTFAALLGHLYGAQIFNGTTAFNGLGLNTAFCFIVLEIGCLAANRDSNIVNLVLSDSIGGVAIRRLLPIAIFLPAAIGFLDIVSQNMGFYDTGVGGTLTVLTSIVLMSSAIFYFTSMSHHSDLRRRAIENKLATNEKKFRELFDYGQSLISLHDLEGNLQKVNPALLASLGFTNDEVVGKNLREFLPEEFRSQFDIYLRGIEHEGISEGYLTIISKNGERKAWRYHNILVSEKNQRPYVLGHAQDVTQLLRAEKALHYLSLKDDLTKLYNRRGFLTHAEQQLKLERHSGTARGLNLLFVDMDGLKRINDTYGHEAGSEALAELSNVLESVLRSADLVARWGGDEFVILTIGSTGESSEMMADRIRNRLIEYNLESDRPYDISCSIGIAQLKLDGSKSIEDVIDDADKAMYRDKKRRKATRVTVPPPYPIDYGFIDGLK